MKKFNHASIVAAALILSVGLAGCTTSTEDSSKSDSASQQSESMASSVSITDAWVKAVDDVSGVTPMTGFFMLVSNDSDQDVVITGGSVPADLTPDSVETHEVVSNDAGDMVMQEAKNGITIPAHGSVKLMPGSFHMMLFNLIKPILVGDTVTLTVEFADGSTTDVVGTAYSIENGKEKYAPEATN